MFHCAGRSPPVKVGDILTVPKGLVQGFETSPGSVPLMLLVAETQDRG